MKSKRQKIVTMALSLMAGLCIFAGAFGAVQAQATETSAYAFEGTQIIGAQARLDDKDGLRFVMEMNSADYAEYTKEGANYESGIIIIPKVLYTGELTLETESIQNAAFTDYTPKTVVNGDVTTYQFNAVLTGIPVYATEIAARGYVKSDDTVAYTDVKSCTLSYVASSLFGIYEEETSEYEKITQYVFGAYKEVTGEEVTDLSEIELGVSMNDANAIMLDNSTVAGYSNELKTNLDSILKIDYTTTDTDGIVGTDGKVPEALSTNNRIEVENGKVNAKARDTAAVKASACGGKTSETYYIKVLDTIIAETDAGYIATSETYKVESTNVQYALDGYYTSYPTGYANGTVGFWSYANLSYGTDGDDATVSFTVKTQHSTYIQSRLQYTKEGIGLLIANGYDKLVMHVKVSVSEDVLKTSAFNYTTSGTEGGDDFTESYRNYLDLYTANSYITSTNNNMGFVSAGNNSWANCGKIYVNEWTNIELPLQLIYDNYAQFTKNAASVNNSYETRSWPLFGIVNENYGATNNPTWERTISMKDFYVAKSDGTTETNPVDFSNPDILKDISWPNFYGNAQGLTQVGFKDGTVAGKTGRFLELCNTTRTYGSYNAYNSSENIRSQRYR